MDKAKTFDLRIRAARPEELDKVAQMMSDAYQQYEPIMGKLIWEGYRSDIMKVRSRLADSELIVAELNGQVVGAVTLYLDKARMAGGWPSGWGGLRLLAVSPNKRGLGIAHALMAECIRRARERGLTAIALHTGEFMKDAVRLYERMGFVRVPQYDHHPTPEVTVMAYRLDI